VKPGGAGGGEGERGGDTGAGGGLGDPSSWPIHSRAAAGLMTPAPKLEGEVELTALAVLSRQLMYSERVKPGRYETRSASAPDTIGQAMLVPE